MLHSSWLIGSYPSSRTNLFQSPRAPHRCSRDGVSLGSNDMGSRQSGREPPKNQYPSHRSDSTTQTHKFAGDSVPHDRARTHRDSKFSDCSQREPYSGSGSGNYPCTEALSPHSKRKMCYGRADPPGCSMAGVHRALGKRPQERRHLEVASASVSPKRAKTEQLSESATLLGNSCAIPPAQTPHALKLKRKTCSQVDDSGATASHSEIHLSGKFSEKSAQGDPGKAPRCNYTSFLSETFYKWKNVGEKKVGSLVSFLDCIL